MGTVKLPVPVNRSGEKVSPMPFSAPQTPWNRVLSSQRTVAFGRARLSDVKAVGSAFGATVNHVVLAACTQTLRSYLETHGGAPETRVRVRLAPSSVIVMVTGTATPSRHSSPCATRASTSLR